MAPRPKIAETAGGFHTLLDDRGEPINSKFTVEASGDHYAVTLESRGGRKGGANERNTDYSEGLRLLLTRLGQRGLRLEKALLASRYALLKSPGEASRLVKPAGHPIPQQLSPEVDAHSLGKALQKALTTIGASRGATGGNSTKRLSLLVSGTKIPSDELALFLRSGGDQASPSQDELYEIAAAKEPFDPANLADARRRTIASIAVRQGQKPFRESLRRAYNHTCAVTGCTVVDVLEAAHIVAYLGPATNHTQNGLLLRADIHTLFDLGKLSVDPKTWRVVLAEALHEGPYKDLHGTPIRLPSRLEDWPSRGALAQHLESLS